MEKIDPRHLLINVAKILEKLKIPYFVTGGMAVLIWGRPRFTADIDIVIQLKPENIEDLEKALVTLGRAGYVDKDVMREALLTNGEFNFIDGESGIKVDFWVIKRDSLSLEQLRRRIMKKVLGKRVYFISPEDLLLNKLIWYKETESSRHLEDAESIFRNSKVDLKYIKKWARHYGVLTFAKFL